jgi:hypothetical protein
LWWCGWCGYRPPTWQARLLLWAGQKETGAGTHVMAATVGEATLDRQTALDPIFFFSVGKERRTRTPNSAHSFILHAGGAALPRCRDGCRESLPASAAVSCRLYLSLAVHADPAPSLLVAQCATNFIDRTSLVTALLFRQYRATLPDPRQGPTDGPCGPCQRRPGCMPCLRPRFGATARSVWSRGLQHRPGTITGDVGVELLEKYPSASQLTYPHANRGPGASLPRSQE